MQTIHITLNTAIAGLIALVKEYGYDHTPGNGTNGCVYGRDDVNTGFIKPVCLVGAYIANLGALRALLTGESCWFGSIGHNASLMASLAEAGITMDADVERLLSVAQAAQDDGDVWGIAVTRAVERTQREAYDALIARHRDELDAQEQDFLHTSTIELDALRPAPLSWDDHQDRDEPPF